MSKKLSIKLTKSFEKLSKNPTTELARQVPASTGTCRAKRGYPFGYFNTHSVAKHQKNDGDPLEEKCFQKVLQCRKKLIGLPFSLARYCMLRRKKEKPFWFSSLGQGIQFDTMKFRRTILVSSCGLKKVTIIAL